MIPNSLSRSRKNKKATYFYVWLCCSNVGILLLSRFKEIRVWQNPAIKPLMTS